MFFVFIYLFCFYYVSWTLNRIDRIGMSHKVKVPKIISVLLNPFSDRTKYDIKAVIYVLYSHITIVAIIVCFLNHSLERFNINIWIAVSTAFMAVSCAMGYFCGAKFENNKVAHIMMIVSGILFLLVAVLLIIACVFQ